MEIQSIIFANFTPKWFLKVLLLMLFSCLKTPLTLTHLLEKSSLGFRGRGKKFSTPPPLLDNQLVININLFFNCMISLHFSNL